MESVQFYPAGDCGVVAQFGETIDEAVNRRIARFAGNIEQARIKGVTELVPTFCTLFISYDPRLTGYQKLVKSLHRLLPHEDQAAAGRKIIHPIPVCYGGKLGEDLPHVARHAGLTEQEVIDLHSGRDYLIYMLGFTPGFTYLGGMSEAIATPRLKTPRVKIPAGSVGIAGSQTGVYPIDSPGGWQLIGRTPVRMYDPDRETPILPQAGQYIKFYSITKAEYDKIAAQEAAGKYVCKRHPRKETGK